MHHLIGFKEFLFVVHYYSNIPWFIQFNLMHKFVNMKDRGQVWLLFFFSFIYFSIVRILQSPVHYHLTRVYRGIKKKSVKI